jgi:hypothetical protein
VVSSWVVDSCGSCSPAYFAADVIHPVSLQGDTQCQGCLGRGPCWLVGAHPHRVWGWAACPQVTLTPQFRSSLTLASKGTSLAPLESTGIMCKICCACLLPRLSVPMW